MCLNNGEPCAKKVKKVKPSEDKRNVQRLKTRLLKRCEEINAKSFEHFSILVTCEVTILNKTGDRVDYEKTGEKSRTEQERFLISRFLHMLSPANQIFSACELFREYLLNNQVFIEI